MNLTFIKIKPRLSFTEVLYLIFFISMICAFRAVTSICTGLILLTGIILHGHSLKQLFTENAGNYFTAACTFFFLLQIISLLYTTDMQTGWTNVRLKSGLVFLPLAILSTGCMNRESFEKIICWYCLIISTASLYLLCMAFIQYFHQHSVSSFFYYELINPFHYHPVYFSILVFVALVFLLESGLSGNYFFTSPLFIFLILFLSIFLLLLSSKLVISFYLVYLISYLINWVKQNKQKQIIAYGIIMLIVSLSTIVLISENPISDRFRDIVKGNPALIEQGRFTPSVYFNGLQFRSLQWKLVPEILNERHCWWTGVTPGDAQAILNQKYISLNMYTGEAGRPGHGYLDYNTHSQFLESLLQNGIPGLIVFILICISLIRIAWRMKKRLVSFPIILLLIYSFIESLFQEQYGIVIFVFISLFISQDYKQKMALPINKK